MSQRLTPDQIRQAAVAAGFESRAVQALLQVETGGSGYDAKTGYLLIQFEPSWFRRLLPKPLAAALNQAAAVKRTAPANLTDEQAALLANWELTQANQVEGQVRERIAFDAATRIDQKTAQLATSWGLPQMMGFNHAACGFNTVAEMVESFRQSEANQLAAMLRWIRSKPLLASALKKKEWGVVAYHYNGVAYKQFKYDTRLAAAYASLS
ncbi:N-acetylmuramidase family protein [Hymenobacter sp. HSC-4F20]|uniref:N-acetylmuramidase domain-containing protein n=1 Tax=Hymenobacter sp. HSC-4F20 TaxID=2864135 RepID=UPI001C732D66|nr:N-acetylmuramidase domain-containing protein [Hymenobacter sp. HSC-4F20]MBX0290948.1 N-acetylmuramidase family protein [Hymenobacter sp. HSC-4F20]